MVTLLLHRRHILNRLLLAAFSLLALCVRADEAPDMSGAELFQVFCASCHGKDARGDGPVAKTLKPTVPDLTRIAARNGGKFPAERVRETIDGQDIPRAHGTRAMPVWGWDFYAINREDRVRRERVKELIERLVKYLASIQEE
jgi:mono/diheme cytochrome c family protein